MFRTTYFHHQEDCIVHTALYGMLKVKDKVSTLQAFLCPRRWVEL